MKEIKWAQGKTKSMGAWVEEMGRLGSYRSRKNDYPKRSKGSQDSVFLLGTCTGRIEQLCNRRLGLRAFHMLPFLDVMTAHSFFFY